MPLAVHAAHIGAQIDMSLKDQRLASFDAFLVLELLRCCCLDAYVISETGKQCAHKFSLCKLHVRKVHWKSVP